MMNKFSMLVLLVLGLVTVGCQPAGTWHVTPELQDAAYQASDLWCDATNGAYCPVVDDPLGDEMVQVPVEKLDSDIGHPACGQYLRSKVPGRILSQRIEIADATGRSFPDGMPRCIFFRADGQLMDIDESLVWTIAHELGHAAGLPDLAGDDGVGTLMGSDAHVQGPTERDAFATT